jgi:hypothetical protein
MWDDYIGPKVYPPIPQTLYKSRPRFVQSIERSEEKHQYLRIPHLKTIQPKMNASNFQYQ